MAVEYAATRRMVNSGMRDSSVERSSLFGSWNTSFAPRRNSLADATSGLDSGGRSVPHASIENSKNLKSQSGKSINLKFETAERCRFAMPDDQFSRLRSRSGQNSKPTEKSEDAPGREICRGSGLGPHALVWALPRRIVLRSACGTLQNDTALISTARPWCRRSGRAGSAGPRERWKKSRPANRAFRPPAHIRSPKSAGLGAKTPAAARPGCRPAG